MTQGVCIQTKALGSKSGRVIHEIHRYTVGRSEANNKHDSAEMTINGHMQQKHAAKGEYEI